MAQNPLAEKAKPDEGTLMPGAFESLASQKVQLDIDDAPFLMELPDDVPAPAVKEEAEVEEAPKKSRKKLFIILGIVLALIVTAGLVYYFFLAPEPEPTGLEPIVIVVPSTQPDSTITASPVEKIVELEPFWVPIKDESGKSRFAKFTFVLSTYDDTAYQEITQQTIKVRDTIYYYLINRPYGYLIDAKNLPTIREELVTALQKDTIKGSLNNLYFNSVMVQ